MPTEQLGVPVLGDAEQPDLAVLDGGDLGRVGRPHHVRRLGDDPPIVRRVGARASAMGRQQAMLAHEPQHSFACHPHAVDRTQPGPDLPVSFAGPRRIAQGRRGWRPAAPRRRRWASAPRRAGADVARRRPPRLARSIEGRARHVPDPADPGDAVAPAGGRGVASAITATSCGPKGRDARFWRAAARPPC